MKKRAGLHRSEDAKPKPRLGFWRRLRVYFRRFRILVWLLLLGLAGLLLYVNQVGLPAFLKNPLLDRLREGGIDLTFSRLRVRWNEGVVAENVQFGQTSNNGGPRLTAEEVQLRLNAAALAKLNVQVDSLQVRSGKLVVPVTQSNAPPRTLIVDNIQTDLRLLPRDRWALDKLTATCAGAQVHFSGIVTNASAIRTWRSELEPAQPGEGRLNRRVRDVLEVLDAIRFAASPDLRLDIQGDARDLASFSLRLLVNAPEAQTPWGDFGGGQFSARLFPAEADGLSRVEAALQATHATTRWAVLTNFNLGLRLTTVPGQTNLVSGHLEASADQAHTPWAAASKIEVRTDWVHSITNPIPVSGRTEIRSASARSKWVSATNLAFIGDFLQRPDFNPSLASDPAWGWWTNLAPYTLGWELDVQELRAGESGARNLASSGLWEAPILVVTNVDAHIREGTLNATARLNVATRALQASLRSDCEPQLLLALFSKEPQPWLQQMTWLKPPRGAAEIAAILPAWTNSAPDWRGEVEPTVVFSGQLQLDQPASYRGIVVSSARSHFYYSNLTWRVPDLRIVRPEGALQADYWTDNRSGDYRLRISSTLDPAAVRPVLTREQDKIFNLLQLTNPPSIAAELWGRWREPERLGLRAQVALTNVTFRGQPADWITASCHYSNQLLQVFSPALGRGTQQARADGLAADFKAHRIYLTNAVGTADPMWITRAIGPHVARAVEAYHFLEPPTARVEGTIPMRGEIGADLHFQLHGGPFHWWKFKVPGVEGHVHWKDERVTLRDMKIMFYDGIATGLANFDFSKKPGTEFQFAVAITNALLHDVVADLFSTNQLEGRISGNVIVDRANTENWRTVNGYGDMALRNGLIWDVPVFGIFSPVLNGLVPGLGNVRASSAKCSFLLTNGVVRSQDMEIRSSAFRLQYRGDVDLEGALDAKVEAELLRDMWVVGPLVSTVFWPVTKMFEYKVTGTLGEPKSEPVYVISKLVLLPFRPLRSLKGLLPDAKTQPSTNAPPAGPR